MDYLQDPYVPYVNEGHFGWPLCPYDGIYNVSHPEVGTVLLLRYTSFTHTSRNKKA